jgi:parallel beta-helix repeat protein
MVSTMIKVKKLFRITFVALICLVWANKSEAATITVSNPDAVQSAIDSATTGDIIQLRTGHYGGFTISGNGKTVKPYPGDSPYTNGSTITISGSNQVVDGLVAENNSGDGFYVTGTNNTLRNCRATNNGRVSGSFADGITVRNASGILIENCVAEKNGFHGISVYLSSNVTIKNSIARNNDGIDEDSDGFHIGDSNNVTVDRSIAENNAEDGFDVSRLGSPYTGSRGVKIYNSIARGNGNAGFSNNAKGSDITIINNLSYDNQIGYNFYDYVTNVKLYHNTSYDKRHSFQSWEGHTGFDVRNNNWISTSSNATVFFAQMSGYTFDYNNIYNTAGGPALGFYQGGLSSCNPSCGSYSNSQVNDGTLAAQRGIQQHGKAVNPLFVNASGQDFHLGSASPVTGGGIYISSPAEVLIDYDRRTRPQNPSLGAYQYGGSVTSSPTPSSIPPPSGDSTLKGDLNNDRIVNSLDWSLMNSKWFTSDATADLNSDGIVNSLDFSIMNGNWLKSG